MRMTTMTTMTTLAVAATVLAACSSGGSSGGDCCCKHGYGDKVTFGASLKEMIYFLPGSDQLSAAMRRAAIIDPVGEAVHYSSSQQGDVIPNAAQDFRFSGVGSRYLDFRDLGAFVNYFPQGKGPAGTTYYAGDPTSWTPGLYSFFYAEFEGDLEFENPDKNLTYATVFQTAFDNWVGNAQFDRDWYNGTGLWLQLQKDFNADPRLSLTQVSGTSAVEVPSRAAAIVNGNAVLFVVPRSELQAYTGYMRIAPYRSTAFDNLDGNFGFGTDQWSGDQTPDILEPLQSYIEWLQAQNSRQVLIDAKFVSLQANSIEDYGVSFDFTWQLTDTLGLSATAVSNGNTQAFASRNNFGGADGDNRYLWIPGMQAGGFAAVGVPAGTMGGFATFPQIPGEPGMEFLVGNRLLGNVMVDPNLATPYIETTDPTRGIVSGTVLDPIQLSAVLSALQADTSTKTLSQPKITTLNGQHAVILHLNEVAAIDNVTSFVQQSAQNANPNVTFVETGLSLMVEPTVHDDDFITMNIVPVAAAMVPGGEATIDGRSPTMVQLQLPVLELSTVQTTVTVPDRGSVILGGFTLEGETEVQPGVPWLSRIPVLNRALTTKRDYDENATLIVIMTASIVNPQDQ